jgi:hypothetical protein
VSLANRSARVNDYRHTQVGWMTIGIVACVTLLETGAMLGARMSVGLVAVMTSIPLLVALLFGSMTVTVDQQDIKIRFGVGLIHKRFALNTVRLYRPVQSPWYYGWGIKMIPGGWMYNVSGSSAVELLLEGGRYVRIGTDEPDALLAALRATIGESSSLRNADLVEQPRRMGVVAKIVGAISAVMVAGILTAMYFEAQPPTVTATPQTFSVRSALYRDDIPMREVATVSLEQSLPRVLLRTNGFAMGSHLRGHFRLDQMGSGQLFVERNTPPFIVVRTRRDFVIVNFEEPERTRELFEVLARYHEQR